MAYSVLNTELILQHAADELYQLFFCIYLNCACLRLVPEAAGLVKEFYGILAVSYFCIRYEISQSVLIAEDLVFLVLFEVYWICYLVRNLLPGPGPGLRHKKKPEKSVVQLPQAQFAPLLYKDLLEMIPSSIVVLDQNKEIVYVNNELCKAKMNI